MTAKEYIEQYVKPINNHVRVESIPESGAFCETCWNNNEELVPATFKGNKWVCPNGHERDSGGYTKSAVVYGPR
jgi:hypothetical protein